MSKRFKLRVSIRLVKKKTRKQSFNSPKHCRFCTSAGQEALLDFKNVGLLKNLIAWDVMLLVTR